MIGAFTPFGWLIFIGILAIIAGMAKLGWHGQWGFGALLTLPFVALLTWIEATVSGPPMWEDPYGPMLFMIVLGPAVVGWLFFLLFRIGRRLRQRQSFGK